MATIVTRAGKGSPLTHDEVDANFGNLNTDKLETSGDGSGLTNIARKVWESSQGSGSSANYWAKVATYSITGDFDDGTFIYHFMPEELGAGMPAIIAVNVRTNNASGGDNHTLNVELMSKPHATPFSDDSFKLIDNGGSSDIELWVKKNDNNCQISAYEMSAHVEDSGFTIAYNQNAAWQASEPTGSGLNIKTVGVKVAGNFNVTGSIAVSGTVDGRDVAADGTKLDGIEASADVTDTANVTAAGALMDSELASIASVKALDQGVATTDSPTFVDGTFTGNVGIGTTSPDALLHVSGTGIPTIKLEDTDVAGGYAHFEVNGAALFIEAYDEDGTSAQILFKNAGVEAMRITEAGNVGIGKTNPATPLDVTGTVTATAFAGDGSNLTGVVKPADIVASVAVYVDAAGGASANSTSDVTVPVTTSEIEDSTNYSNTSGVVTVTDAGTYVIKGNAGVGGSTGNYRWTGELSIVKNGSTVIGKVQGGYIRATNGSLATYINIDKMAVLAASDTIELKCKRISNVTGNATFTADISSLQLHKL